MIFPGPPFPPNVPPNGEGQFFPPLPQKVTILFHSGNKRQFKFCSKSVSNYQNQLVEAEKLLKKVTFLPDSTVPLCKKSKMTKNSNEGVLDRIESRK